MLERETRWVAKRAQQQRKIKIWKCCLDLNFTQAVCCCKTSVWQQRRTEWERETDDNEGKREWFCPDRGAKKLLSCSCWFKVGYSIPDDACIYARGLLFQGFPPSVLEHTQCTKKPYFSKKLLSLSIEFKKSCSDDATSASSRHYQRAFGMKMEWKNLMPSVLSIEPADEDKGTGEKLTDDVEPGANYKYKLSHWSFNIVYCIIQNNIILFWRESIKKYTHSSFDHRKKNYINRMVVVVRDVLWKFRKNVLSSCFYCKVYWHCFDHFLQWFFFRLLRCVCVCVNARTEKRIWRKEFRRRQTLEKFKKKTLLSLLLHCKNNNMIWLVPGWEK